MNHTYIKTYLDLKNFLNYNAKISLKWSPHDQFENISCEIQLSVLYGKLAHVYLFFRRKYSEQFSGIKSFQFFYQVSVGC